jgi:hypothetical protein
MRSIYKYSIVNSKDGVIEGPITKLLTAQVQHGDIVVWAEVDTEKPNRKFQIISIGTGWPLDAPAGKECVLDTHQYIGTVQFAGGGLIFHVYAKELTPIKVKKPEPPKEKTTKAVKAVDNSKNKEATFSTTITMINPDVLRQFLGC